MLFLGESDVRRLLSMDSALELVERAFLSLAQGTAFNQPRRRVIVPQGATLHVMAAADAASGYLGAKIYSTSRETARFLFLLFRSDTGEPLAQIGADYLGQVRTGAASGVATRHMASEEAAVLAVVGTGKQARTQVQAIARVRKLRQVRVFSRDAERRAAFAAWVTQEIGIPAQAAESARQALEGAQIAVTATTSRQPVVCGEWLEQGMHLNAIGSNSAVYCELDDAAVARAEVIVTDSLEQARLESGELIAAFENRPEEWSRVRELCRVVSGEQPGRESSRQITLFKSNGIALEDVAVGGFVYEQALARGFGRQIPAFAAPTFPE